MALSDLAVFSDYLYQTSIETLGQEIDKFNEASNGTIILNSDAFVGDYNDVAFYKRIDGMVKRRDVYGSGSVTNKTFEDLIETAVKIAAGTPEIVWNSSQFSYLLKNAEESGARVGAQLAEDMLADMLNTAINALHATMAGNAAMTHDGTASGVLTYSKMNLAGSKMGDRSQSLAAWITHSQPYHDLIGDNLANAQSLFSFGTVNVATDHLGKPIIVTDALGLQDLTTSPDEYGVLGLVPGAVIISQNDDFNDNETAANGSENITKSYQAEWTYNMTIKGYAWDKTNGGKSPTDAALATATNWDKYVTIDKDGPGVLLNVATTGG